MPDSLCYLEPLPPGSMLARIGGPEYKPGEPYEIIVVIAPVESWFRRLIRSIGFFRPGTAEVKGLDKRPTVSHWRALDAALRARGYRFMRFDRVDRGVVIRRTRPLIPNQERTADNTD